LRPASAPDIDRISSAESNTAGEFNQRTASPSAAKRIRFYASKQTGHPATYIAINARPKYIPVVHEQIQKRTAANKPVKLFNRWLQQHVEYNSSVPSRCHVSFESDKQLIGAVVA
jgi:hypothetical protein